MGVGVQRNNDFGADGARALAPALEKMPSMHELHLVSARRRVWVCAFLCICHKILAVSSSSSDLDISSTIRSAREHATRVEWCALSFSRISFTPLHFPSSVEARGCIAFLSLTF